jgi:hypothetical protein
MQTRKKTNNVGASQQVSTKVIHGMKGFTNEGCLEARVMGQQTNVENAIPLVPTKIVEEEQVEAVEDVGETSKEDVDQIEMDLNRTILIIENR